MSVLVRVIGIKSNQFEVVSMTAMQLKAAFKSSKIGMYRLSAIGALSSVLIRRCADKKWFVDDSMIAVKEAIKNGRP